MQIGIDVGATKIEYILLHDNGEESGRSRIDCPKDYNSVIKSINEIIKKIEKKIVKELPTDDFDYKLDYVLTEKQLYSFK